MSMKPNLFVGVTTWNSANFLPVCLGAIRKHTQKYNVQLVVLDNCSDDESAEIAREFGATVIVHRCRQGDALNSLLKRSNAPYSLLLHSDVVLLSSQTIELCMAKLNDRTILVSPEDIGCGPYTRPFGVGKPESSFLFVATKSFRRTAITIWKRWHLIPYAIRRLDFYGDHISDRLPERISACGYSWRPMLVHASDRVQEPIYSPPFQPSVWSEELSHLRYGLGNFYSLDGVITHYHNWYDRLNMAVTDDSRETTGPGGEGFPLAYIRAYSTAFLRDYHANALVLPAANAPTRTPVAL